MAWLRRFWIKVLDWFRPLRGGKRLRQGSEPGVSSVLQDAAFRVAHVHEEPDELEPRTLYAVGENGNLWHIAFICPCGCGATIALNALVDDSPCWTLIDAADGPSLDPSVWRTTGCRSHFILRRGRIVWCHERRPAVWNDDG